MPISLQPPRASESLDHLSRIDLVRRRQRRLLRRSSVPSGRWRRWRWGSPARVPGRGTTTPSSAGDLRRSAATRGRHRLLPPPHYKVWDLPGELSKFCNSWHEMITLVMVYKGQRILELKEQLKLCSIWDMLFFWMAITIFYLRRSTQVFDSSESRCCCPFKTKLGDWGSFRQLNWWFVLKILGKVDCNHVT